MHALAVWIREVLVPALGAPGLFLAAILDALLFLPETNDILVVSWAAAQPRSAWVAVAATALGSLAGNLVVFWTGRKGGEAFLVRRFGGPRVARMRTAFDRWDVLALGVPAVMPPPVPFKAFVFAAGVFGVSFPRFALTVFVARVLRYGFWSLMAARYGEAALAALHAADLRLGLGPLPVLGALAAVALAGLALRFWLRRRAGRRAPAGLP